LAGSASAAQKEPRWEQHVTKGVKRVMGQQHIPGVIVGIWRHGRQPYVKAFGVRSRETHQKMDTGLFMRLGSETKTFTATAVLQQVDAGRVGLDDPISKYVDGVPNGGAISIRQLLGMRSGLASYTFNNAWQQQYLSNPKQQWQPTQLLGFSFSQPPLFAPGATYNYSNTNYILLGLVVERVTGQNLGTYIRKNILLPLGMTHTVLATNTKYPSPHPQGYTMQTLSGRLGRTAGWNPSWGWAAGSMISTLDDLRTWAYVVATGRGVLSRATQQQRTQFLPVPHIPSAAYGLGLDNIDGWIGHNGSLPGYESVTSYLPSKRTRMVLLLNTDIGPPTAEPSTLVGTAITKVISPAHIYEANVQP
jgi:D-alanyl-D-alanine carboxypeptidase